MAFLIAVALNAAANGVLVAAWRAVLAVAGAPLAPRAAAWVWSCSQLARYTVGGAQVAGREALGRRYGLPAWTGGASTLVEVAWSGAITAAIALATVPWWLPGASDLAWLAWAGAAPVAVLAAVLVRPGLAGTAAGIARRLRPGAQHGAAQALRLRRRDAARITLLYALNAALRIAAFLALFEAAGGSAQAGLRAAGAVALGQLVGWLAAFAPGGLGVREGATALVAAPAIGAGPAVVLAVAMRLAELAAEALYWLLARCRRPARTFSSAGP